MTRTWWLTRRGEGEEQLGRLTQPKGRGGEDTRSLIVQRDTSTSIDRLKTLQGHCASTAAGAWRRTRALRGGGGAECWFVERLGLGVELRNRIVWHSITKRKVVAPGDRAIDAMMTARSICWRHVEAALIGDMTVEDLLDDDEQVDDMDAWLAMAGILAPKGTKNSAQLYEVSARTQKQLVAVFCHRCPSSSR